MSEAGSLTANFERWVFAQSHLAAERTVVAAA